MRTRYTFVYAKVIKDLLDYCIIFYCFSSTALLLPCFCSFYFIITLIIKRNISLLVQTFKTPVCHLVQYTETRLKCPTSLAHSPSSLSKPKYMKNFQKVLSKQTNNRYLYYDLFYYLFMTLCYTISIHTSRVCMCKFKFKGNLLKQS